MNVESYIKSAPEWAKKILQDMRKAILSAAPKAKESISYKMPYYSFEGRIAYFGAFKKHCSFFWVSGQDKKTFAKELAKYKVVGNTLQFLRGERVSVGIIKKLVKAHLKENSAKKQAKSNKKQVRSMQKTVSSKQKTGRNKNNEK